MKIYNIFMVHTTHGNYRSQISTIDHNYNVEYNPYTNTLTKWNGEPLLNNLRDDFLKAVKEQRPETYKQIVEKSTPRSACTFKEALVKLADQPATDIVARLKALSKERDSLFEELKRLIPLEKGYVWGEAYGGTIRPWATEQTQD